MASDLSLELMAEAWSALGAGGPQAPQPLGVDVTGESGHLPSRLPVEDAAIACVSAALLAAVVLHQPRGGKLTRRVTVDRDHVSAAVRSERYFRRATQSAGAGFAPLSRFWRTADGWVRTHANYPWHRAALLRTLETTEDPDAVGGALAELRAEDVEERVFAAGGVATAVRPLHAWRDHPQGRALAREPLVGHQLIGDAPPHSRLAGALPATGVRVLDFTRVIAGPVCTRFLAALGAEVLRLDPPDHPDMRVGAVADTLLGKRSARLDLDGAEGRATLDGLLAQTDVVVCGYRPGALDRFGLSAATLAERHPGLVIVYLDAWGHSGPWAGRRGFDSVVQAPTGIAMAESDANAEPGALPCQLLDHGTGYLAAAAVLDGLSRQSESGGTHVRRLSLARTAWWLTSSKPREEEPPAGGQTAADSAPGSPPWLTELDSADGPVSVVTPPGTLDGQPLRWPFPLTGYGNDPPTWSQP